MYNANEAGGWTAVYGSPTQPGCTWVNIIWYVCLATVLALAIAALAVSLRNGQGLSGALTTLESWEEGMEQAVMDWEGGALHILSSDKISAASETAAVFGHGPFRDVMGGVYVAPNSISYNLTIILPQSPVWAIALHVQRYDLAENQLVNVRTPILLCDKTAPDDADKCTGATGSDGTLKPYTGKHSLAAEPLVEKPIMHLVLYGNATETHGAHRTRLYESNVVLILKVY